MPSSHSLYNVDGPTPGDADGRRAGSFGSGDGEQIAESRVQTDASLGAERASTDVAIDLATHNAQRVQDDLIERDRLFADERLLKFRDRAASAGAWPQRR